MENYKGLLKHIMENGTDRPDRTSVGSSRFITGANLSWNLAEGFPILTLRRVALRIAFEETMFFLRGDTDTTKLEEKNINIWKGNTTREFLDERGLSDLPVGSLGKGYSHQWRNFGGDLGDANGVDQVEDLLNGLRQDPTGRRHLVTAWNPLQLHETPLPPCHLMHMYSVNPEKETLNSCFIMRSNDVPYGLPYNIMGYALLNHIFAKHLDLEPGELSYFGWDAHIYENQKELALATLDRDPLPLPKLIIHKDLKTLDDIMDLQYNDIELVGYNAHPDFNEKPNMAV